MSERPSSTLCSIVRGFPIRVAQEVAQTFELGICHSLLSTLELGHSLVDNVGLPGLRQRSCFRQGSPLTAVIDPEPIPIYKEGTHNL